MSSTKKFFLYVLLIFIAYWIPILQSLLILDVSELYGLDFIYKLSFVQILGFILAIKFLFYRNNRNYKDDDLKGYFEKLAKQLLYLMISWGFCYIYFYMFQQLF